MTTLAEKIAVMQAADKGEQVESRHHTLNSWTAITAPRWDWSSYDYRIKRTPQVIYLEENSAARASSFSPSIHLRGWAWDIPTPSARGLTRPLRKFVEVLE